MDLKDIKKNISKIYKEINETQGINLDKTIKFNGILIPKYFFENETYQKTLQCLFEDEKLNKILSDTMITGTLNNIVRNNLDFTEEFKKLTDDKKNYKVYVPIKGILLFSDKVIISNKVKIMKVDHQTIKNYIPKTENDQTIDLLIPTVLEVDISTADFEKAMQLAIDVGKYVANFLRLVEYNGWDNENITVRLPGYGSIKEGLRVYAVDNDKRTGNISWQNKKADNAAIELDNATLEDIKSIGSIAFGKLIDKYLEFELSDLQKSILRSITWFGESKTEIDNGARFIKLMLSIECLLNSKGNNPITATIRDRMAFLLGETFDDRTDISKKMRDLYNLRSEIVHHGNSQVNIRSLLTLEDFAANAIIQFLTNDKLLSIEDKTKLNKHFEKIKYS